MYGNRMCLKIGDQIFSVIEIFFSTRMYFNFKPIYIGKVCLKNNETTLIKLCIVTYFKI